MALTRLQGRVMRRLASNRPESSYVAGGVALNRHWPRQSDDIDIFHDTDEGIAPAADKDLESLRDAGFQVRVDIQIYGIVEATVREYGEETQIQWMSESRWRFLPLIRDEEWGVRLAPVDLAVNKILAAGTRRQARDAVDLAQIGEYLCPLGPLLMASAAKPPYFSPGRMLEGIRRNSLSFTDEEILSVQGMPDGWEPAAIRERILELIGGAERYLLSAPPALVGRIALSKAGIPVEISERGGDDFELRAATAQPEVMPDIKDLASSWPKAPRRRDGVFRGAAGGKDDE